MRFFYFLQTWCVLLQILLHFHVFFLVLKDYFDIWSVCVYAFSLHSVKKSFSSCFSAQIFHLDDFHAYLLLTLLHLTSKIIQYLFQPNTPAMCFRMFFLCCIIQLQPVSQFFHHQISDYPQTGSSSLVRTIIGNSETIPAPHLP